MRAWFLLWLHRLRWPKLRVSDFKVSREGEIELRALSALARMSIFEVCEIVRLCEPHDKSGRKAVERVRNLLLEMTKADHNILPHEQTKKLKSDIEKKNVSPLLPRYDNL